MPLPLVHGEQDPRALILEMGCFLLEGPQPQEVVRRVIRWFCRYRQLAPQRLVVAQLVTLVTLRSLVRLAIGLRRAARLRGARGTAQGLGPFGNQPWSGARVTLPHPWVRRKPILERHPIWDVPITHVDGIVLIHLHDGRYGFWHWLRSDKCIGHRQRCITIARSVGDIQLRPNQVPPQRGLPKSVDILILCPRFGRSFSV